MSTATLIDRSVPKAPETVPTPNTREAWFAAAAVVVAVIAYASSVANGFVWDDVHIITNRPALLDLANWREILTAPWWEAALFRPLTRLSFAVDWTISGGSPHYFHAVNVLLHGAVTSMVYLLARRWLGVPGAAVAALLFAVHPVHVEAVASVVGRAEVLATLFAVAAALLYCRDGDLAARGDVSWRRVATSLGTLTAMLAGAASKESALAIPGILLVVDWLEARRADEPFAARWRRHWILWTAAVVVGLEWLAIRSLVLGELAGDRAGPGLLGLGFVERVWVMAGVVVEYVRLLVFPAHLSADYSPDYLPAVPSLTARGVAGFAIVAAAIAGAWKARHRAPIVAASLAWIGGTLLVVSNLLVPTGVLLAERSMYLPSVGIVLLAGYLASHIWQRSPKAVLVAASLVAAAGLARTMTRVPIWKDASTFFPNLVYDAPGSFRSLWTAGLLYYDLGDRQEGERLFREALDVYPLFPNTWHDFGGKLRESGRWAEAGGVYAVAFGLENDRFEDAALSIDSYARAGMRDSARAVAERASAGRSSSPALLRSLGVLAESSGLSLEAMTLRRQAAWLEPSEPANWYLTARSALDARHCPEVERSIRRFATLSPPADEIEELTRLGREVGCGV